MTDTALDVQVLRLDERIDNVGERLDRHEKAQNGSLDKIWAELKSIRDDMKGMGNRPTWAVFAVLGLFTNLSTALIVYELTH